MGVFISVGETPTSISGEYKHIRVSGEYRDKSRPWIAGMHRRRCQQTLTTFYKSIIVVKKYTIEK